MKTLVFFVLLGVAVSGCVAGAPPAPPGNQTAVYDRYDAQRFIQSMKEDKGIIITFYTDGDALSGLQQQETARAFANFSGDVVGFLAHINDNQTTDEERLLAKNLNVTRSHTFLVIDRTARVMMTVQEVYPAATVLDILRTIEDSSQLGPEFTVTR